MQFSATVTTVTREAIVPKVYDIALSGNVGLMRLLGNSKPWPSGFRYDVILKFQASSAGGIVGVGGTLDTSRTVTRVRAQFEPQRLHKPVVIDDIEIAVNEGDKRVLELLAVEMDSIAQDLANDLGQYLYTGTGAAGLSFDSLDNAADDSTNYATYGTLARATYAGLNGSYTATIGALQLSDLTTTDDAVTIGSEGPSLILTTPAVWTAYEALLNPTVQLSYTSAGYPQVTREGRVPTREALRGQAGFDSVFFRGTPMVKDERCTAQRAYFVNEKYFGWKGLDLPKMEKVSRPGATIDGPQSMPIPKGANWSGMMSSPTQPAEVGHFYFVGNFISEAPRYLGQLRGITG